MAITGDGFFPLESQDGQTKVFSRSGAFILNESGNIVNRSSQRLLASPVDGAGNAIGEELQTIAISPQTIGEAAATTKIDFSINLPSSAEVIQLPFDPNNPATYNKSSVIDLYDAGGNVYPATVYYVKTASADASTNGGSTYNPEANQPSNKWQTHILIDGVRVQPALQQASDEKGDRLYVNEYGEVKPESEVIDELVLGKTPKFTLDDLANVRQSLPANIAGGEVPFELGAASGFNFFQDLADPDGIFDQQSLENFIAVDVDGSANPVIVDISELALEDREISGSEIARFIENQLNEAFGDDRYFDLSTPSNRQLALNYQLGDDAVAVDIDLEAIFPDALSQSEVTVDQLVGAIQDTVDAALGAGTVNVSYDPVSRNLKYVPTAGAADITLVAGPTGTNDLFGLTTIPTGLDESGLDESGFTVIPNGAFIRPLDDQRYGIEVRFNAVTNNFEISSGTTGDDSSLTLSFDTGTEQLPFFNEDAAFFMGYAATAAEPTLSVVKAEQALRGLTSLPGVTFGSPLALNVEEVFAVTPANNQFNVTVNGISGSINLPVGSNYTIDTFTNELSRQINQLVGADGASVSGVSVNYDDEIKAFVFTTGTTGNSSFIKVTGDSMWGLANTTPGRGTTTSWIKPEQSIEVLGGVPTNIYIDEFGNETTDPTGFAGLPAWSPIFLDKGELTFDKQGNLISPAGGLDMETAFLGGGGSLDLSIDFSGTTQFNQAFNVRNQKQDGLPEGDLVGLDIGEDGLITASYSNGSQLSIGKVLLANFPSADGLSARGDSVFLATAKSGAPLFGEPGSAAFGSIRAGALERSNVDLTSELIGLITAQRNFQANAKAIETSSTLTSTILNI